MKLTLKELIVDGIQLPTPALEGLTITTNKIWSANTGRLESTGEMAGTIVATKRKLEITWPDLTMESARIIEDAVSSMDPFHELRYTDMTGKTESITVYFGDINYTIYSYSEGIQWIRNAAVAAIEK
jgi:hypothetical protein